MHTKGYYILRIIMFLCYDDKLSVCGLCSNVAQASQTYHHILICIFTAICAIKYVIHPFQKKPIHFSMKAQCYIKLLSEKYDIIMMRILFLRHNSLSLSHTQTKAL